MTSHRRRRVAAWVAILAILLNTFTPAVAHALAAGTAAPWLEICTDTGLNGGGGDLPGQQHASAGQHCPYCAPHGASFAAPPVATSRAVDALDGAQRFAARTTPAPPQPLWLGARSRAPPVL